LSRSAGVGLLAGGAQRTAAEIHTPRSCESPGRRLFALLEKPVRWSEANRKSPDRSPVK